jgi:hypothetical protein
MYQYTLQDPDTQELFRWLIWWQRFRRPQPQGLLTDQLKDDLPAPRPVVKINQHDLLPGAQQ